MKILARCLKALGLISVPFAVFAFSIQGSRSNATQAYNKPLLRNADIKETAFVKARHLICEGLVTGGVTGCTLDRNQILYGKSQGFSFIADCQQNDTS
jgi:hypothetical protein